MFKYTTLAIVAIMSLGMASHSFAEDGNEDPIHWQTQEEWDAQVAKWNQTIAAAKGDVKKVGNFFKNLLKKSREICAKNDCGQSSGGTPTGGGDGE